ncbi:MAG: aldehyde dehydrogenase family protein [Pseudomonadota bacterium]
MIFEDLRSAPSHVLDGEEVAGSGSNFISSVNPYTGDTIWTGYAATAADVDNAVRIAKRAFPDWASTPYEARKAVLLKFTALVRENEEPLIHLICDEAGKTLRDARTEIAALIEEFRTSVEAYETRCKEHTTELDGSRLKTRYLPRGVMAVIGPFNCPLSMSNGLIMPALLAGNAVVFKPSEHTPLCGAAMTLLWQQAGLYNGVLNSLTGGVSAGEQLASHAGVDGILFVGGHAAGMSIFNAVKDNPEKVAALDMGGNNPLILHDIPPDSVAAASKAVIQSAFAGGGQICTAARRLIVSETAIDTIDRIIEDCKALKIGNPSDPQEEPYYGPLITPLAARKAAARYSELVDKGAISLLEPNISGPANTLMSPGILDVTDCDSDSDEEILAPILKLYRYDGDINAAVRLANATRFGLSAGIICAGPDNYRTAQRDIKAALFHWNRPMTSRGSLTPVGGLKQSGNLRPAGSMSCDHCAYPVIYHESDIQGLKSLDQAATS